MTQDSVREESIGEAKDLDTPDGHRHTKRAADTEDEQLAIPYNSMWTIALNK